MLLTMLGFGRSQRGLPRKRCVSLASFRRPRIQPLWVVYFARLNTVYRWLEWHVASIWKQLNFKSFTTLVYAKIISSWVKSSCWKPLCYFPNYLNHDKLYHLNETCSIIYRND